MKCFPCVQQEHCDMIDNDCDGKMEEEFCNGIDDDGDGLVDEDCCASRPPPTFGNTGDAPASVVFESARGLKSSKKEVLTEAEADERRFIADEAQSSAARSMDRCWDLNTAQACYGEKLELHCPPGEIIRVMSAHFGRQSFVGEVVCDSPNPLNCDGADLTCGFNDALHVVRPICEGKAHCAMGVSHFTMGDACSDEFCPLCQQYALVYYLCDAVSSSVANTGGLCYTLASRRGQAHRPGRFIASSTLSDPLEPSTCSATDAARNEGGDCPGCVSGMAQKRHSHSARRTLRTDPDSARMSSDAVSAWCPTFCDRNTSFLQMDLGGHYSVTGYLVQGRRSRDHWVETVGFAFSSDGETWNRIEDERGEMVRFPANSNPRQMTLCRLSSYGIVARYMRLVVLSFYGYPCLHVDYLTCDDSRGCPPLTVANSDVDGEPAIRGTNLLVKCKDGWMTKERLTEYEAVCDHTGQWSSRISDCSVAIDCGDIPLVRNALHDGRNTRVGSRVTFTCSGVHHMHGNATIRCLDTGLWSDPPYCV